MPNRFETHIPSIQSWFGDAIERWSDTGFAPSVNSNVAFWSFEEDIADQYRRLEGRNIPLCTSCGEPLTNAQCTNELCRLHRNLADLREASAEAFNFENL